MWKKSNRARARVCVSVIEREKKSINVDYFCLCTCTQKALYDFGGPRSIRIWILNTMFFVFSFSPHAHIHTHWQQAMLKITKHPTIFFVHLPIWQKVSHTRIFISFQISTKRFYHIVKMNTAKTTTNSHEMRSLNHAMHINIYI